MMNGERGGRPFTLHHFRDEGVRVKIEWNRVGGGNTGANTGALGVEEGLLLLHHVDIKGRSMGLLPLASIGSNWGCRIWREKMK